MNRQGSIYSSVVDTYLEAIEEQKAAKAEELDPEFRWISVTALLLLGILKCTGVDDENA